MQMESATIVMCRVAGSVGGIEGRARVPIGQCQKKMYVLGHYRSVTTGIQIYHHQRRTRGGDNKQQQTSVKAEI
jgi:hypothetical protein